MIVRVFSAALQGVDATEVEIEVHEAQGNPQMIICGLKLPCTLICSSSKTY